MDLIAAPLKAPLERAVADLEATLAACDTNIAAASTADMCELPDIAPAVAAGRKAMALVTSMLAALRRN